MIQQCFFFAPAVPDSNFEVVGDFDGSISPVVEICRWEAETCQGPLVARYTTGGQGADRIRVSMEDEHYGQESTAFGWLTYTSVSATSTKPAVTLRQPPRIFHDSSSCGRTPMPNCSHESVR